MASTIFITFGDRTVIVARPATYQHLLREPGNSLPASARQWYITWRRRHRGGLSRPLATIQCGVKSTAQLAFGDRTVMVARPQTYQDLLRDTRSHYPMIASVQNLVFLSQPLLANGNLHNQWAQVDPTAYGAIHDGAEIFINIRPTDGLGNPLPADGEALDQHVNTKRTAHPESKFLATAEQAKDDAFSAVSTTQ
ncbi:hypothetical protein J7T55_005364 [Diaporthe amygdali]|uniref:uncharacterized protein n=1 Tax=Phomopsis amygdali TaxID=1214568 RepID=UPI0022FDF1A5|nr:uncharacterized protein J7T55_005364 [Diaporthe amygdali]KAJ0108387.1 hypothetical protein J7T55_005364 [Diaporthe amygdali]